VLFLLLTPEARYRGLARTIGGELFAVSTFSHDDDIGKRNLRKRTRKPVIY